MAYLIDEKNHSRNQALVALAIVGGAFTVMSALSFGMLHFFTEFISYGGQSKSFFDVIVDVFYDTILPLNGLLVCLFVSFRWKKQRLNAELEIGNDSYRGSWMEKYVNFSLSTFIPVLLLLIFANTVAQKFFAFNLLGI